MRNYVIINGVNSLTKNGLAIKDLPPITKTMMRTLREEIDGRDGDIITELGYSAYDKSMTIGLFGTGYDIDDIIAFFNQSGTIVFSNEPDKFYNFKIIDQIDYNKLLKFKEATIRFHCQPFKYPLNEVPLVEEFQYVEATGSDITLDNTAEAIFNKIELQGNTSQVSYTGINLAGITDRTKTSNGITATALNNVITITGTSTAGNNALIDFPFINPILQSTGDLTKSLNTTGTSTGCQTSLRGSSANTLVGLHSSNGENKTGTISADSYYFRIQVNGGVSVNCTMKIQVEAGTTAHEWQPYVGGIPSPNPNYPQDIHVVSGENVVEITGKNIYNKEDINLIQDAYIENGGTLIRGTYNKFTWKKLRPNTTYTLSQEIISLNTCRVGLFEQEPMLNARSTILTSVNSGNPIDCTFTTTEKGIYLGWTYCNTNSLGGHTETEMLESIQLEVNDHKTDFEPYTEQTYPLSLGNLEMASIPNTDYKDTFVKIDDVWYKRESVEKKVLDGSEAWTMRAGSRVSIDIPSQQGDYVAVGLSNKFKNVTSWEEHLATNYSFTVRNGNWGQNLGRISFIDTDFATVTAWKQYLASNNVIVYFQRLPQLGGAIDIEITDATLIEQLEAIKNAVSYGGQTNITQTNNDLPFILDLSALELNSDHLVINNIGNIYSKPTLDLEGTGIVDIYLNDIQMFEVDLTENNEIIINTDEMEAFNPETGALANRQVTGEYDVFKLDPGENDLRFSGNLTKATITNYERWL